MSQEFNEKNYSLKMDKTILSFKKRYLNVKNRQS